MHCFNILCPRKGFQITSFKGACFRYQLSQQRISLPTRWIIMPRSPHRDPWREEHAWRWMNLRRFELHDNALFFKEGFVWVWGALANHRNKKVTDRAFNRASKSCHVKWIRTRRPHLSEHRDNQPHRSTYFERLGQSGHGPGL